MSCENGECVVYEEYNKKQSISNCSLNTLVEFVTFKINRSSMAKAEGKNLEKLIENKFLIALKNLLIAIEKIVAHEKEGHELHVDAIVPLSVNSNNIDDRICS